MLGVFFRMEIIMKKFTLILIAGLCSAAFALPFNNKISNEEIKKLESGEVIIRNIDYAKNMCISSTCEPLKKIIDSIHSTNPNYLAEVIQVKPVQGNENLASQIRDSLENIQDYAGIPYWSVRNQRYFDLYSTAKIINKVQEDEHVTKIDAELFMDPFGTINQPIRIEQTEDYLFYESTNSNNLKFQGINVVRPYAMKSVIVLFKDGDNWILYGAGGVKAPRVPFLTERIETSFINRIKTFCNFVFTKMDAKVSEN